MPAPGRIYGVGLRRNKDGNFIAFILINVAPIGM
jgi:hypothetical protein